jgi:hypothetical protein
MADPWLADPWLAAEARSSLKSRGLMCCAACLLVKIRGYSKVNWVHDPASLAGQSIGRGRDERYSGRFLKVLITRRLRKKEGCLGRDVLEGRRGRDGPVRTTS